ncbi:MAG: alkaline shock response membrane anchor protein AmaP [Ruminiclostridium sp.]|nr:alkaline shock response membrane anchor protein AmaP [Ruminiclostridium sp.]
MNIFFRVLLAFYAFCLAVISAIIMLITVKTDFFEIIYRNLDDYVFLNDSPGPRIAMFLIGLLFFVLSLMFLLSGVKSNKDKKAVSKHTNIGEVRISLNSIENIALNASRKVNGVKESKAYVKRLEDSVAINVKMVVMPEMNIPAISGDVQERVKKSVEESSGIDVKEVKIIVDSIYSGALSKTRVE